MISIKNITKKYPLKINGQETIALNDVSFEIGKKEFVSIVGKSGAGKTTLLRLILAEEEPSSGEIFFGGENIHQLKRSFLPRLRQKIGVVFQDYKLFEFKTVYENIAYIMEVM